MGTIISTRKLDRSRDAVQPLLKQRVRTRFGGSLHIVGIVAQRFSALNEPGNLVLECITCFTGLLGHLFLGCYTRLKHTCIDATSNIF